MERDSLVRLVLAALAAGIAWALLPAFWALVITVLAILFVVVGA